MAETDTTPKIPDFFTREFFKKSLENGLNIKDIVIDDFQLSAASAIGENYLSTVYRAKVKCHQANKNVEEISLIVKNMIMQFYENKEFDAFEKEAAMYEIFPKIEELYMNREIFIPKCFYIEDTPTHKCIVLQDLTASGFKLGDRVQRLDEAHCIVVLQKLAKYHAGTIVLAQKEPKVFELFNTGFYRPKSVKTPAFKGLFYDALEQFIEYMENWKCNGEIIDKMKRILNNFDEKFIEGLTPKPNQIQVLNHGDLWTNNLLFKYANENIEGIRFIDLQVSMNDSLGLDINYFFSTSVGFDVLQTKREKLIQCYHESLKTALDELNYSGSRPSLEDVKREIDNKAFYGLMISLGITPIIIMDREESKDSTFESFKDKNIFYKKRHTVFSNPKYQNFMKHFLEYCDTLRVLD